MKFRVLEAKVVHCFYFTKWFVDACERHGAEVGGDSKFPHFLRVVLGRYFGFNICKAKGSLVVCGWHRIESKAWPFNYFHDIVPMMWDVWPVNYHWFARFLKFNRVRLVFCTSAQNCSRLRARFPEKRIVWIPEAVDINFYPMGPQLRNRGIDVLSYGRQFAVIDQTLKRMADRRDVVYQRGTGPKLEQLVDVLRNSKIAICYPRCDTNPEIAGDVETLTIRYWEAMLTGVVLVGRSPKELIDVCGYDPVVPMEPSQVEETIKDVLSNLAKYQQLVERNRKCAEIKGGWADRIPIIVANLNGENAEYPHHRW